MTFVDANLHDGGYDRRPYRHEQQVVRGACQHLRPLRGDFRFPWRCRDMADSDNLADSVGIMVWYLSNPYAMPLNSTSLLIDATNDDSSSGGGQSVV